MASSKLEVAASPAAFSSTPDLDLAVRHRYGDPKAFEQVYQQYSKMVYNLAFRMAGTSEKAEDFTQEIFIRIYRHLGRFNGRSTLKTWVYRVAINHCRSKLSRKRFFFQPLAEEQEEEQGVQLVDGNRGPEDLVLANDIEMRVRQGLRQVKQVFREAVVLRDLEGLPYDEIADILKVRIGTVRSRIARGREQLRVILEPSE